LRDGADLGGDAVGADGVNPREPAGGRASRLAVAAVRPRQGQADPRGRQLRRAADRLSESRRIAASVPVDCRRRGNFPRRPRIQGQSTDGGSAVALSTILIILLILILVGAIPAWPYSRNWGYGPSGIL